MVTDHDIVILHNSLKYKDSLLHCIQETNDNSVDIIIIIMAPLHVIVSMNAAPNNVVANGKYI